MSMKNKEQIDKKIKNSMDKMNTNRKQDNVQGVHGCKKMKS